MKFRSVIIGLAVFGLAGQTIASAPKFSTIQPSNSEIAAAAATASTASYEHANYVQGERFDRIFTIWLENADYAKAAYDTSLAALATNGITLTNYWALTHPSEPNYLASVGGDYFGLASDSFVRMPRNVSTVVDLLESRNISWAEYQEDMPYSGFQGWQYVNQKTKANDYGRKHNPLISYDSVVLNPTRLANIKNFTQFTSDVGLQALPQWAFITPNMTNSGHDTTVQVAGAWAFRFLTDLFKNAYFLNDTLVVLTFDENETYQTQNRVLTLLLGDITQDLKNTTDDTFYNHYSLLASVQSNWDLPSLGRHDCNANVFDIIGKRTGYQNRAVNTTGLFNNQSAPGWLVNSDIPIPAPTGCLETTNSSVPTTGVSSSVHTSSAMNVARNSYSLYGAFVIVVFLSQSSVVSV
jgi:acid phosphatase